MRLLATILFISFLPQIGNTQLDLDWARTLIGTGEDYSSKIITDKFDNVYGVGYFRDTLENSTSKGFNDIIIYKYNPNGNLDWTKSIGSASDDFGLDICTDNLGYLYITGFYKHTLYFNQDSLIFNGGVDAFVAKLDTSGLIIWAKGFGNSGNESGNAIHCDNNGGIYISGTFGDSLSIDGQTLTSYGSLNNYIIKLNTNGSLIWHNSISSPILNNIQDLKSDTSGNLYLTGHFRDILTGSLGQLYSYGHNDVFLAKFSTNGNLIWWKRIGSTAPDQATAIAIDENNLYVSGIFQDSAYFDSHIELCDGEFDAFLAQYDLQGNFNWVNKVGGFDNSKGYDIAILENHNVLWVGYFEGVAHWGTDTIRSKNLMHFPLDIFIAEYSLNGTYQRVQTLGGTATDYATTISITDNNNVYISGNFQDTVTFDSSTTSISTYLGTDIFMLKFSPLVISNSDIFQDSPITAISVYPNPANQIATVSVELAHAMDIEIIVHNYLGQRLQTVFHSFLSSGINQLQIDLSSIPSGYYLLTVLSASQKSSIPLRISK